MSSKTTAPPMSRCSFTECTSVEKTVSVSSRPGWPRAEDFRSVSTPGSAPATLLGLRRALLRLAENSSRPPAISMILKHTHYFLFSAEKFPKGFNFISLQKWHSINNPGKRMTAWVHWSCVDYGVKLLVRLTAQSG